MATSQASAIFERLKQDIVEGSFGSGEKLRIEALQLKYESGSTPVREALTRLAGTGLVEQIDQRGFRVSQLSLEKFDVLVWTRAVTEGEALRDSIRLGDEKWEEAVVLALYHLSRTSSADEDADTVARWEASNESFHRQLISACRSTSLLQFCAQLYDEGKRYRYLVRSAFPLERGSYIAHKEIADAALARQADLAVALLVRHYQHTADLLRTALTRVGTRGELAEA